ncbi:hypothetical protein Tsubulata_013343, partial [Turnera subulata]
MIEKSYIPVCGLYKTSNESEADLALALTRSKAGAGLGTLFLWSCNVSNTKSDSTFELSIYGLKSG